MSNVHPFEAGSPNAALLVVALGVAAGRHLLRSVVEPAVSQVVGLIPPYRTSSPVQTTGPENAPGYPVFTQVD